MIDEIKELKRQNRSLRDRIKNLEPKVRAVKHVSTVYDGFGSKILPDDFKVRCCVYDLLEKSRFEIKILQDELKREVLKLYNIIEKNGKEILRLRGNKWSI